MLLLAGQLLVAATDVAAQGAPASHRVGGDDNLAGVAAKYKYPDVSLNQMMYALVVANPNAFASRTTRQLKPGYAMVIPPLAKVKTIDAATADREVARFMEADKIYREGVAAEGSGNMTQALQSYLTSAQMGHGLASVRLGELYDRDATKTVPRDLRESIRFYQEARNQGIKIKGPISGAPDISRSTGK